MHWSSVVLASLAGFEAVQAHGHGHRPMHVVGGRKGARDLRSRTYVPMSDQSEINAEEVQIEERAKARQTSNTEGQCGGSFGSCATGYCCSSSGWCGNTPEYCNAPDCQINYGPGCDGNKKPSGADTSGIARPKVGSIPYGGVGIYNCVNDGDIAITYDDGPYLYTSHVLDLFKAHNAAATFFITGNNLGKGMINDASTPYPGIIKRMIAEGHQVASHTWSHENASQLTTAQMKTQMIYNEIAFNDILGFFPTYMRPPYSICPSGFQQVLADLGYHITYFDLDTEGYLHTAASQIQTSVSLWDAGMTRASACKDSYLHIEHDIHYEVAYTLTAHILDSLDANGWRAVTVGECLGDPAANWYRAGTGSVPSYGFNITAATSVCGSTSTSGTATGASSTSTSGSGLTVSTDGSCGTGITCQGSTFGNCCSQYGWCGDTTNHCDAGCQASFGTCAGSSSASSAASSAAASSTSGSGLSVSTDGTCGSGITCLGSEFGDCCSQYGWCGTTTDHCDIDCQTAFGSCTGSGGPSTNSRIATSSTSSAPAASTSTLAASTTSTVTSTLTTVASSSTSTSATSSSTKASTTSTSSSASSSSTKAASTSTSLTSSSTKAASTSTSLTSSSTKATSTTLTSSSTSSSSTSSKASSTSTAPAAATSVALKVSKDGKCGKASGQTCEGYLLGSCCGSNNKCGFICLKLLGCQDDYGVCLL